MRKEEVRIQRLRRLSCTSFLKFYTETIKVRLDEKTFAPGVLFLLEYELRSQNVRLTQ